ncbi:ABC transporter ATP-binding protein [Parafrankia sp. FMc6]|uniref:ABC transporter ATP-binding protein n=1 Tax=Parafrankia soli TaxID=2599596 RepID=UPI0034D62833
MSVLPAAAAPAIRSGRQVVLELDELSTHLATSHGPVTVVDGVSLRLGAGETVGVVGESGSGKSMLMRTVMDVLPAGARITGTVRFTGTELGYGGWNKGRHLRGSRLAMVFQDSLSNLNPVRTIGAQLADPLRHHLGLSRRSARSRARELLELVQLTEPQRRLRQYPHELSGGMRQRVMLAMALACRPDVLIADEPTTALDVTVQRQILDLLADLRRELGMAVLLGQPRPRGRARPDGPGGRDVRGRDHRVRADGGAVRPPAPPLHPGVAGGAAEPRPAP